MTLSDTLAALVTPDHFPGGALLPLDLVFNMADAKDLTILSVYYCDGQIHVDIGSEEDTTEGFVDYDY